MEREARTVSYMRAKMDFCTSTAERAEFARVQRTVPDHSGLFSQGCCHDPSVVLQNEQRCAAGGRGHIPAARLILIRLQHNDAF